MGFVPADSAIRLVGGRYRLTGKIGEGGMEAVYKCFDQVIGRQVAVKMLGEGTTKQEEVVALASARHRNGRPISHARAALVLCCVLLGSCTHRALVWVPEPEDLSCRVDSDCTIATEVGCCGCQVQPYAVSRSKEEERLSNCSVALCACQGICLCPPTADPGQFRPACERNRCVQRPLERQVIKPTKARRECRKPARPALWRGP